MPLTKIFLVLLIVIAKCKVKILKKFTLEFTTASTIYCHFEHCLRSTFVRDWYWWEDWVVRWTLSSFVRALFGNLFDRVWWDFCSSWGRHYIWKEKEVKLVFTSTSYTRKSYFLEKSLKHKRSLFCSFVISIWPSAIPDKKTNAISIGPWLTVVPIHPCKTIWRILGSAGSWMVDAASSFVFFWMSSIATSIGSRTICCRLMTWILVFTDGKWLLVVRMVFLLYCSCSSPWAFPAIVKGVEKINRLMLKFRSKWVSRWRNSNASK